MARLDAFWRARFIMFPIGRLLHAMATNHDLQMIVTHGSLIQTRKINDHRKK